MSVNECVNSSCAICWVSYCVWQCAFKASAYLQLVYLCALHFLRTLCAMRLVAVGVG